MTIRRPNALTVAAAAVACLLPGAALGSPLAATTPASRTESPAASPATGSYIVVRRDDAPTTDPRHVTSSMRSSRGTALRTIAASVGATPTSTTTTVLSSFTAPLTGAQVQRLRARSDVLTVVPDRRHRLTAVGTPGFLGLTGTGAGSWQSYGGTAAAGRGVVIGLVDSGIWPESPAFRAGVPALAASATTSVGVAYRTSATATAMRRADGGTFHGDCSGRAGTHAVEAWSPSLCNQAVVSARAFPPAAGIVSPGPNDPAGREFYSPRDGLGHGTHTASTAGGRTIDATDYTGSTLVDAAGKPRTSTGVAPGAALAEYKACWTTKQDADGDGLWDNYCTDDSLVAAVDQAVRDGVDVLNISISGTTDYPLDPLELAMLGAARAGVLVVASAGNDGPSAGTVNHPVPWAMTVGDASWSDVWTNPAAPPSTLDTYSGRGPTTAFNGAVLKPDVVAPGVDVVASVPPPIGYPYTTGDIESMSGTSMAAPHVAGLAAMLLAKHPTWSPMMVRSALSTTAAPLGATSVFGQGSGMVDARTMDSAELLLDATPNDYLAVARWAGLAGTAAPKDPADVNAPSIVLADVAAKRRTTRYFTATRAGVWRIGASVPGYRVAVSPRRGLALKAGQRIPVTVTVTRTTAARGAYAEGSLVLSSPRSTIHLPLVARTR